MDKNYYITTPIYYPSAKPHMGHAYSSIAADFFARFKRIDGFDVHFLTGTDEHGLKIQRAAEKRNVDPQAFCDEISQTFRDLSKTLNLSNTDFIRTTEERHKKTVQHLWTELEKNDDIYLSKYSGWYSVSDEAFYSDEEITEKENIKIATVSGSPVEWIEEESYFFRLSKWQDELLNYYEKNPDFISPKSRKNEVISFVKGGLKDLSISRKAFSWGIKVPNNPDHVIYVWLDALTNYISALNYPDTNDALFKKFWPASVHLIGKDILRFHSVYWPAFLMAAKIPLPKKVYGHGWILSGDEKMSKSKYNVVNPDQICEDFGADTLRMYEMFLGPIEQAKPWNTAGMSGVYSFLKKTWKLFLPANELVVSEENPSPESLKTLHQTIKKVTEDIENFSFNTCISAFMICVNELSAQKCNQRAILEPFTILLSPFAPHIAEELWSLLGHKGSISQVDFPVFDEKFLVESTKNYPISFNGKMRFTRELALDLSAKEIEKIILADEQTQEQLQGRTPKKVIVVPGKIINIVG